MTTTTAHDKSRLLAAGLALVLLVAGAVIGVSVDRLWLRSSTTPKKHHWKHHTPEQIVKRFRAKLGLTDEQAKKIVAIIRRVQDAMHAVKRGWKPQMRKAHERAQKHILAVLNEDQVVQYKKMIEMKMRHHRKFKGHGPHGHPGPPHR